MAPIRVEVLLLSGRGVAVTAAEGGDGGGLKNRGTKAPGGGYCQADSPRNLARLWVG